MKADLLNKSVFAFVLLASAGTAFSAEVELGPRPEFLVGQMKESGLKERLEQCLDQKSERSLFSIAHRGAPLMFPEHTVESNVAAARMGAGILECDVTFTEDLELVCRHSQNDLHTTTNILATDLGAKCTEPFRAAGGGSEATAECRTTDISLSEFKSLRGKMDGADKTATSVEDYLGGTAPWRTELYATSGGTLMTHAESIRLFRDLGGKFMPELKAPVVGMPFKGFSQEDYAQKLVDEYKAAAVPPEDVWLQSFNLEDVLYWIENEPEFGKQAVYLDGRRETDVTRLSPDMTALASMGVRYIAPPLWVLLSEEEGRIVPSAYARAAREAGLKIITWTLERSGPLNNGGGWYFQSIANVTDNEGVYLEALHVLAQDVGVEGVFSDWPATVTFYANCMGL
ncbi:glycerophosphodiester phosphodiesterase family protein [Kiloniella sp. b19]|uniref:glycerophosphodiester phosphodiesterase family protein n=1 Tax=Kiloniella sp. GXU_MW_B19 TaxID=3141326 RepID=UPI0031DDAE8D